MVTTATVVHAQISTDASGTSDSSLISITSPTSDSSWSVGKSNYIRWTVDKSILKVNITLTNTDTGDEITLKNGVSASRGYYIWNISKTLEPGSYTITVTDANNETNTATSDPFTLTVKVSSIKITSPASKVSLSSTLQLDATVSPDNASDSTVTWTVKNGTGKATIDTTGLLTPTKVGTVTVTATANDGSKVKSIKTITVTKAVVTKNQLPSLSDTGSATVTPITAVNVTTTSSTVSPVITCKPNWQCADWSKCYTSLQVSWPKSPAYLADGGNALKPLWNQQIRTCTDTNNCGVAPPSSLAVKSCTPCTDFNYSAWKGCFPISRRTVISYLPAGCADGVSLAPSSDNSGVATAAFFYDRGGMINTNISGWTEPTTLFNNPILPGGPILAIQCEDGNNSYQLNQQVKQLGADFGHIFNPATAHYNAYVPHDTAEISESDVDPTITPNPVTACQSNWSCTAWGPCSTNPDPSYVSQKYRSCSDTNHCATPTDKPATSQSCVCNSVWKCDPWLPCAADYTQSRNCVDQNKCEWPTNMPVQVQSCGENPPPTCTDSNWSSSISYITCPSVGITLAWTKIGTCINGVQHPPVEYVSCSFLNATGFIRTPLYDSDGYVLCTYVSYTRFSECDRYQQKTRQAIQFYPAFCSLGDSAHPSPIFPMVTKLPCSAVPFFQ